MTDSLATGAAFAIALGLVEVIKALVAARSSRYSPFSQFTADDRTLLREVAAWAHALFRWHEPGDDGRQEWKNPGLRLILEEIRDALRELVALRRGNAGP